MTSHDVEVKGYRPDADDWSVNELLDSLIQRLEVDIEKYSSIRREYNNFRFLVVATITFIYALISIIILQLTIDGGVGSVIPIAGEEYSKRIFVGSFIVVFALFVLTQIAGRIFPIRDMQKSLLRLLEIRLEFAEQVLVRITTWEQKFDGDFYEKSILRLKLETLSQLIDEIKVMSGAHTKSGLFRY